MNKVFKIVLLILAVSTILSTCVLPTLEVKAYNVAVSAKEPSADTVSGLNNVAGNILGLIQVASGVLAVVLVAVFGFKFIMGSAQEKSDYMKSFIPLIVGVAVVFSAVSIAKLIFSITGT